MGKKQTAVEWYYQQTIVEAKTNYAELLEQAKAMEKDQIAKAHGDKKRVTGTVGNYLETYSGEQYYNDNYK